MTRCVFLGIETEFSFRNFTAIVTLTFILLVQFLHAGYNMQFLVRPARVSKRELEIRGQYESERKRNVMLCIHFLRRKIR